MGMLVLSFQNETFHYLFVVSLWVCCISFAGVVLTKFTVWGGQRLEYIFARTTVMSAIPLVAAVVHLLFRQVSALVLTVVLWMAAAGYYSGRWRSRKRREEMLIQKKGFWRCPNCRRLNESIYMRCLKCEASKIDGTQ